MGLAAHATVARATALSRRGLPGHCPGPTGRVTHQMVVCCLGHLSGDRVKECGPRGRPGAICSLRRGHRAGTERPAAGPSLH